MTFLIVDYSNQDWYWQLEGPDSEPIKVMVEGKAMPSGSLGFGSYMNIGLLRSRKMFIANIVQNSRLLVRLGTQVIDITDAKKLVSSKSVPFAFVRRFSLQVEDRIWVMYYKKIWFDQEWPFPGDIFDHLVEISSATMIADVINRYQSPPVKSR